MRARYWDDEGKIAAHPYAGSYRTRILRLGVVRLLCHCGLDSPPPPSPPFFPLFACCNFARVGKYRLSENYIALDSLHLVSLADGPKERRNRWTFLYMLQITLNLGSSFLLLNNMRALICRGVY
jgi:hypothetical protein